MKRYVDPNAKPPPKEFLPGKTKVEDSVVSDISIDGLINDGLLALYREIKNLLFATSQGKLDAPSSRDLRDHIKLLFEIKDREQDTLKHYTEEELRDLIASIKAEDSNAT
jgi:hypothetical protein